MTKKRIPRTSVKSQVPRMVSFKDVDLFVGLDVAKRSWKVTVRTREVMLRAMTVPPLADGLARCLEKTFGGARFHLVYEAGCFGYWIHDALVEKGIEVLVVAPNKLPQELVKTDRLDSAKLARLLASGLLRGIWIPSGQVRMDRSVVRRRQQLLRDRIRAQDQIKKALLFHGRSIAQEPARRAWTRAYVAGLRQVRFSDPFLTDSFQRMVDDYERLRERVRDQQRLITDLASTARYRKNVALLRTIPGVGILTAMIILVEIQDFLRFARAEQFASYIGVSPQQYSTGDRQRVGHITRAGNQAVRCALVELAWRAIRRDPALLEKYTRTRAKRGAKIAIVAIARRLALRIRRVLIDQRPYVVGRAA